MTHHDLYKSAMDKVSPGSQWQQDTLKMLAKARQEAGFSDRQPNKMIELKHAGKTKKPSRHLVLPIAAAACLALLVPFSLHYLNNDMQLMQAGKIAPANMSQEYMLSGSEAAAFARDEAADTDSAPVETFNGLPVIHWFKEITGHGGTWEFLATGPDALITPNPTFNLPDSQMPDELPVWIAASGPTASQILMHRMEQAALYTGLTLAVPEEESCPDGYPEPSLWPYYFSGKLMNPTTYQPDLPLWEQPDRAVWNVDSLMQSLIISDPIPDRSDRASSVSSPQMVRIGCEMANNQLGDLVPLEHPAFQCHSSLNYYGRSNYDAAHSFLYEAGNADDPIETKLYNYSFKRIHGKLDSSGNLGAAHLTYEPVGEPVGYYPVRSLQDAKDSLDRTLDMDRQQGLITYDLTSDDIVNWRIEYYRSPLNGYILPLYIFNLETPMTPGETPYQFEGASLYTVYVEYWVSALPDDYCVESLDSRY